MNINNWVIIMNINNDDNNGGHDYTERKKQETYAATKTTLFAFHFEIDSFIQNLKTNLQFQLQSN